MKRILLLFLVLLSIGCVGQKKDFKDEVTVEEQKQDVKIQEEEEETKVQKQEVELQKWKEESKIQELEKKVEWRNQEEERALRKKYPFLKNAYNYPGFILVPDFQLDSKYFTSECDKHAFFDVEDEELYFFEQCHGDSLPLMMVRYDIKTKEETLIPTIFDNQSPVKINSSDGFIILKIEGYSSSQVDLLNKFVVLDMKTEKQTIFTFAFNMDIPNSIRSMLFIPEFEMIAIGQAHSITVYKYNYDFNNRDYNYYNDYDMYSIYDSYVVNGPQYPNTLLVRDGKLFYSETQYINLKDLFKINY